MTWTKPEFQIIELGIEVGALRLPDE